MSHLRLFPIALLCLFLPLSAMAANMTLTATVQSASVCGNNVREAGEQCDGSDLGTASCNALGFAAGTLTCSFSCQFEISACTTAADNVFSNSFPISGGQYTFSNLDATNVSLTVPPGSFSETITLDAFAYPPAAIIGTQPPPSGTSFVGRVYDFRFLSADGDLLHTLLNPVTVTLPYLPADIVGLDEAGLAAYRRDDGDTEWHLISDGILDTNARTVTFTTTSFSFFTIIGRPAPASSVPASSGSLINLFGVSLAHSLQRVAETITSPLTFLEKIFVPKRRLIGDLNSDGKVTLSDFSVLAYWYKRLRPPAQADLNNDGLVDITDFSILAHYWTGGSS